MMDARDLEILSPFLPTDIPFTAEERQEIFSKLQIIELKRGDQFLRQGDAVTKLGVVLKGIFKCVRVGRSGGESIISFPSESMIITDYASWLNKEPATFYIEALEPARVAILDYADYHAFLQKIPGWQTLVMRHLGATIVTLSHREHSLLAMDARQRYQEFLTQNQGILNRIKRKDMASYLGITPVFLSRLSSKKDQSP